MAIGLKQKLEKIDALMEKASQALASSAYFDAEAACVTALERAHIVGDFERMARIALPLQEARRQKRDLAVEAGDVFLIDGAVPDEGDPLKPGCYLVQPPRVGMDGRALRELLDRSKIPAIVVVREPITKTRLWPVVSIGPVTIRTRLRPPEGATEQPETESEALYGRTVIPPATWFLEANEVIGDAAIESVDAAAPAETRIAALMERLAAHPDHEKLHQRLEEACREAARVE